jgi:murein L,D-transpeptidase YcbB/YkuD
MTINLNKPVPVFIVYFTAFTNTDGDVVFRRDLYQRDAPVIAALRGGG